MRYAVGVLLASMLLMGGLAPLADADVYVKGYYRKDGTYVAPHYRSNPDGNPYNNWSFPGNVNPHTGEVATGDPDTYLNNYYGTGLGVRPSSQPASAAAPFDYQAAYNQLMESMRRSNATALVCPANAYALNGQCYCNAGYAVLDKQCMPAVNVSLIRDLQAQVQALLLQIAALQAQRSASTTPAR